MCKIKTSDYLEIIGDKSAFNKYLRPEDAFNCLAEGCRNTGGLLITGNEFPLGATFKKLLMRLIFMLVQPLLFRFAKRWNIYYRI